MAIGTKSDFIIYDDFFHTGVTETLVQETNVFNGASRGCIELIDQQRLGEYNHESQFMTIANFIQDRDPTSTSTNTPVKMAKDEHISVKIDRMAHVLQTIDSFRKNGQSLEVASRVLGQQFAKAMMIKFITEGVGAAVAAIGQDNEQNNDTGTITTDGLVDALAVLGDKAGDVSCWVMHSKTYFDLVKQQIADNIYDVSSINIKEGKPITLDRPVVVTDSPSLISSGTGPGSTDEYYTLGLVPGAIKIEESEERELLSEKVGGYDNIMFRWQVEYAYNLGLKGYKYDITNGGSSPSLATLTTATNWDQVATDNKDLLGVRLVTQ